MNYKDIKTALDDLIEHGNADTFAGLMSDDFEMLSVHQSSVGTKGKNKEQAIQMMQGLEPMGPANVECHIETENVIVVTHNSVNDNITMAANYIENGKISKCVYFRGPKS
ncbi:hypothetical protein LSUCC0246_02460 [Rhodobacterales bacterium LSUCC0246]|nr:hypothetical protein [Rhodobacterales bacterium LSUCC0374]